MASDGPTEATGERMDANYQRTLERLTTIAQITNPVIGANPLSVQVHCLLQQVRSAYEVDACIARTIEGNELVLLSADGVPASKLRTSIPADVGIASDLIRGRQPMTIENVELSAATAGLAQRARRDDTIFAFVSYAGAPLLVERRVVGVLGLYVRHQPRRFTYIELNHLQIVANHIAISIMNDRLYRELLRKKEELEKQIRERERSELQCRLLEEQLARHQEGHGEL